MNRVAPISFVRVRTARRFHSRQTERLCSLTQELLFLHRVQLQKHLKHPTELSNAHCERQRGDNPTLFPLETFPQRGGGESWGEGGGVREKKKEGGRGRVTRRRPRLYLLRRGLAASCSGRSSSGPPPWRRCRPDWRGSCCRCPLPS